MSDSTSPGTASRAVVPPGTLPGTLPTPPGSGPRDGMRPPPWWKLDPDFLDWIAPIATRGLAGNAPLSERDLATLRALLHRLRGARTRWLGGDRGQSARARLELVQLTGYLSGFLDGKKLTGTGAGALTTGLLAQDAGSLDEQLDELERLLEGAIEPTRGPGLALAVLGGGAGIFAYGVYKKIQAIREPDTIPD